MDIKLLIISSVITVTTCRTIPAAISSKWDLDVRQTDLQQDPIEPQVIEVPAVDLPVKIIFNSKSSGVYVQQIHHPGAKGQTEATQSEEEPHRVVHQVVRPVIQEIREVIVPFRRVIQTIRPVVEDIQTQVAKGNRQTMDRDFITNEMQMSPQTAYKSPFSLRIADLWKSAKEAAVKAKA